MTAVAVAFYFATTNPNLRGVLDAANKEMVTGWVVDEAQPFTRVEVQLFVDDQFAGHATADKYRPDVREARRAADDWHGFVFNTPRLPPGNHEARVYAVYLNSAGARRTLQLIGKPYQFRTE